MDEQLARILVQPLGRAQQRQRAGKAILLQFMQRLGVRFAQHVVDRVDRPLALLRLQPGQPLLERPVEEAAAVRDGLERNEAVAQHLPGIEIVLAEAVARAVDDGIGLLVLEQHADDGRLRHERLHPRADTLVARQGDHIGVEAGAVVVIHRCDALLQGCGAERCGIDREVAALGVTAEQELPRKAQHGRGGITRREALGRNGAGEGHVEILLPADERAVRPAEGDKMPPVAEGDGDGRKLRLALEVDLVYIIHDPHLAEALTRRKGRDEPPVLRQEQRRLRSEELPHERADRRSLRRNKPVERQVFLLGRDSVALF